MFSLLQDERRRVHSEVWSSDGSYTVDRDSEDGGRELDRDAAGSQHSQGYSEEFNSQVFKQGSCKKKKTDREREREREIIDSRYRWYSEEINSQVFERIL